MADSQRVRALLQEGAVIVASILLAFAFDAWWNGFDERRREAYHLEALEVDFRGTRDLLIESLATTEDGRESAKRIVEAIRVGTLVDHADSLNYLVLKAVSYEVFRPQRGAYDALVNSGEFGLLQSDSLRSALAAYFGTFDDARASERILLEDHRAFFQPNLTPSALRNDDVLYLAMGGELRPVSAEATSALQADPAFRSWMTALWKDHLDLTDDYTTLLSGAEAVLEILER